MLDYRLEDQVAVLHFDDGKANAVSHDFIASMNDGLDRASSDAQAVVIVGRAGRFSAGFDLDELQKGPDAATALVQSGARMLLRIFTHPQPVVAACTGHALAAGAFLLLSCDTRFGMTGDFKIGLNETAIGMGLPVFGFELAKARLSRRYLTPAVTQAKIYDPPTAAAIGFLDEAVAGDELLDRALGEAQMLGGYASDAYAANKLGLRREIAATIEASLA